MGTSPSEVLEGKIPQGLHARLSCLVYEWVHLNGFGLVEPGDSRYALSSAFRWKHIPWYPLGLFEDINQAEQLLKNAFCPCGGFLGLLNLKLKQGCLNFLNGLRMLAQIAIDEGLEGI